MEKNIGGIVRKQLLSYVDKSCSILSCSVKYPCLLQQFIFRNVKIFIQNYIFLKTK